LAGAATLRIVRVETCAVLSSVSRAQYMQASRNWEEGQGRITSSTPWDIIDRYRDCHDGIGYQGRSLSQKPAHVSTPDPYFSERAFRRLEKVKLYLCIQVYSAARKELLT